MKTVHFKDNGQDFLEWDIEDQIVVACRPFQEAIWKGTKVFNKKIRIGTQLTIGLKSGETRVLKHRVIDVL